MRKTLLLSFAACMIAHSASAFQTPKTFDNASFQGISPNGNYLVSDMFGTVTIYDIANDNQYSYSEDETGLISYSVGVGNFVSNNGVVLASTTSLFNAAYWKDGKWTELAVPNPELTNLLNGITPDGKRICGNVGSDAISIDASNLMQAPAYWDLQADGTYSSYNLLPHPDTDFLGRTPQYITATYISADGKVIAGQVMDYSGGFCQPIVYTQGDDGKWSYKLLLQELFTPEGEIPADPGEAPWPPEASSFMTPEEQAAYDAAMQAYWDSGYDETLFPEVDDYLSADAKAAYQKAKEEYQKAFDEWAEKQAKWSDFFDSLFDTVPTYQFNDLRLSSDGKQYVTTLLVEDENSDPMSWGMASYTQTPIVIDIASDSASKLDFGISMAVTQVLNDGIYLAHEGVNKIPDNGYIIRNGKCMSIYDYLAAFSPDMEEWMQKNMVHEVEEYDWETGEFSIQEYTFTGMPLASADLSVLSLWTQAAWDFETIMTWGCVIDMTQFAGIADVAAGKGADVVKFDASGALCLGADVVSAAVYDLSGRLVLSATGSTVANSLAKGVYVVKALCADGSAITAKVSK